MSFWVIPTGGTEDFAKSCAASFALRADAEQFALEKNVDEILDTFRQIRERGVCYQMNESEKFDFARHVHDTSMESIRWRVFDSVKAIQTVFPNFFELEE